MTAETRYSAKDLPVELQAPHWQSPRAVDLTPSVAARRTPKLDYGDEVEVFVASGINSSQMSRITTTVGRDGMVELPVLGRIPVAGVTADQARQAVVQACYKEGVAQAPLVEVTLKKPRQHHVTVTGAVQHPGVYSLSRQESDLVSALAVAGGLAADAGTKIVIQSRAPERDGDPAGGPITAAGGDLSTIALADGSGERREIHLNTPGGGSLAREELRDGDVVLVERHEPASVVVTGMVQQPGRYPLPVGQEYRILDAIADAHGVSYKVLDRVYVCRAVRGRTERAVIEVNLRSATRQQNQNLVLMPGDVVSVEANLSVLTQDVVDFLGAVLLGAAPVVIK